MKPLVFADREEIRQFTDRFLPYSDYNFISMWSWDIERTVRISQLHNNLILRFDDYINGEPFFSILGDHRTKETVHAVLSYAQEIGIVTELRLIPQDMARTLLCYQDHYDIIEDEDSHDYILSIELLKTYAGNKLGPKRNFVNRYTRLYGEDTKAKLLNIADPDTYQDIFSVFDQWQKQTDRPIADVERERAALFKLCNHGGASLVRTIGLYYKDKLIGFSINEVAHEGYGIIHYEKADLDFIGVFAYLKQQSARDLHACGCTFVNYEQDLGIEGLRKAKKAYRPVDFLKKYVIRRRSSVFTLSH